jgi:ATP-dependent RNA helicase HelY
VFAEQLAMMRPDLVTPPQLAAIEAILETYSNSLRPEDRELEQVQIVTRLARKGIGFHHAGLLPVLKQLVEVLFGRGLMSVVFATDTLALGVNMPARSVVIGRMSKWDGRRRRPLIPNEFQQMAGRAGRRGMDVFGHVVIPYSPWVPFRDAMEIATGPLHPVQSAFAIRYNTVLNLWDPPAGDRVRQMLQRSLAQYQTSQRIRLVEHDILEIESELAGLTEGRQEEIAALDESFEEFRSIDRRLQTARAELRKVEQDIEDLHLHTNAGTPWTEPGRQALRRAIRSAQAGMILHTREAGWAVYLGRGAGDGIGIVLDIARRRFFVIPEYRQIDYLPDDLYVEVPAGLIEPIETRLDPATLVEIDELDALVARVEALDLPDLDAMATAYRAKQREAMEARRQVLDDQRGELADQIRELQAMKVSHPFADNAARKAHQGFLRHRDALENERNALSDILDREIDAEDVRIRNVIRGIRDVLHRFGYLRQGYPTEKADMLADVFDNDGLILCEMVDQGALDPLSPEELAELFSWFSFDRDFRYANHFTLPERLVRARRQLEEIEHDILSEERDHKLFISEGHNPSFYGAALAWSHGATMVQIGEQLELSEGDLVLTFNKTIDLMRQVREMLIGIDDEHPLIGKFTLAERRLRRGIVEQSLSLGFTPIAESTPDDEADEDDPDADPGDTFEDEAASVN